LAFELGTFNFSLAAPQLGQSLCSGDVLPREVRIMLDLNCIGTLLEESFSSSERSFGLIQHFRSTGDDGGIIDGSGNGCARIIQKRIIARTTAASDGQQATHRKHKIEYGVPSTLNDVHIFTGGFNGAILRILLMVDA
jgi:hypothetical protein